MESSFTDVEKRFVLAEMIKSSHMDVGVLVEFIKQSGVQPNWLHMQLPGGRNMNQCIRAAESMFNMPIPPPTISPLKRKPNNDMGDHASKKQAVGSPGDTSPYGSMSRSANTHPLGIAQPVNIKPRPNGFPPPSINTAAPTTPISQNIVLPPRRRGRPPKSEAIARQGASQSLHYPPISPAPIAPSPVQPIAPRPQSPGPSPGPAYQVWPTTPKDTKAKRRGRQLAGDAQPTLPETVPRTVQGAPSSEPDARQMPGPVTEYPEWRDRPPTREAHQAGHGPPPLGPTLPPILPPPPSPSIAIEGATRSRETPPSVPTEQTRQGGHTAAVN